jgi:hypothetical protein
MVVMFHLARSLPPSSNSVGSVMHKSLSCERLLYFSDNHECAGFQSLKSIKA